MRLHSEAVTGRCCYMRRRGAGGARPATTALSAGDQVSPHGAYRGTGKCSFTRRKTGASSPGGHAPLPGGPATIARTTIPSAPSKERKLHSITATLCHQKHLNISLINVKHSYFWWHVESHLTDCFCFFFLTISGRWWGPTNYVLSVCEYSFE